MGLLQGQFQYRVWGGAANLLGQCAVEGEDTGRQRSLLGTENYSILVQPVLDGEGRLESILDIPGKRLCGTETTAPSFTRSATSSSLPTFTPHLKSGDNKSYFAGSSCEGQSGESTLQSPHLNIPLEEKYC